MIFATRTFKISLEMCLATTVMNHMVQLNTITFLKLALYEYHLFEHDCPK